jgi:hypothetical protein
MRAEVDVSHIGVHLRYQCFVRVFLTDIKDVRDAVIFDPRPKVRQGILAVRQVAGQVDVRCDLTDSPPPSGTFGVE